MARLEDKSRQCNIRLVGLAEGEEGSDALGFMQAQLPRWIPSLKNRQIEIDRTHRIYTGDSNRKSPCTLILKLLRFQDRNAILKGARAAGQIIHKGSSLLFFPDYSNQTAMKRHEMIQSRKRLGISSFMIYPATIKVTHRGSTSHLQTPADVEAFADQQQALAVPLPLRDSTPVEMLTDYSELSPGEDVDWYHYYAEHYFSVLWHLVGLGTRVILCYVGHVSRRGCCDGR